MDWTQRSTTCVQLIYTTTTTTTTTSTFTNSTICRSRWVTVRCRRRADVRAQAVVPLCPTLKYSTIHLQYKAEFLIQRFTTIGICVRLLLFAVRPKARKSARVALGGSIQHRVHPTLVTFGVNKTTKSYRELPKSIKSTENSVINYVMEFRLGCVFCMIQGFRVQSQGWGQGQLFLVAQFSVLFGRFRQLSVELDSFW